MREDGEGRQSGLRKERRDESSARGRIYAFANRKRFLSHSHAPSAASSSVTCSGRFSSASVSRMAEKPAILLLLLLLALDALRGGGGDSALDEDEEDEEEEEAEAEEADEEEAAVAAADAPNTRAETRTKLCTTAKLQKWIDNQRPSETKRVVQSDSGSEHICGRLRGSTAKAQERTWAGADEFGVATGTHGLAKLVACTHQQFVFKKSETHKHKIIHEDFLMVWPR